MFSARSSVANKEQLGHVEGGYKTVFDTLKSEFDKLDVSVHYGVDVREVGVNKKLYIDSQNNKNTFDKVIFTAPTTILSRLATSDLAFVESTEFNVEYLGVICPVLITSKPLINYYVVNVADDRVPFTGIIGMSSIVSPTETNGYYLTYLPKYVNADSHYFERSDEEIIDEFISGVEKVLQNFNRKTLKKVVVNRARFVQPLQVLNYSRLIPEVESKYEDFYILNSSQFTENTLNNNTVSKHVKNFMENYSNVF